jgi:hypothetical protein
MIDARAREPRTIRIRVSIDGQNVKCDQTTFIDEMNEENKRFRRQREAREKKAKHNAAEFAAGRVDLFEDDFVELPHEHQDHGPHPFIHLFTRFADQIEWYTEENITFRVHVHRNQDKVRLLKDAPKGSKIDPVVINGPDDNPFVTDFPPEGLEGNNKTSVFSGVLKTDEQLIEQRYFKYAVSVEGKRLFDPDIEGHAGN